VKLLLFLVVGLVLFAAVVSWPALRTDWDYWHAERAYKRLHVGETKARVKAEFGRPPFTQDADRCWFDRETLWPGGQRLYTLCFDRGRLATKTAEDD
jgi:hypothetical protein